MTTTLKKQMTLVCIALALVVPTGARAHCDTMTGPVVTAAKKALASGNVNLVLIWVQKKDEAELREAFGTTLLVRTLSPEARELSEKYFFETVVRLHRAGEGEPYTGLKPAGTPVEPGIAAADEAVASGSLAALLADLQRTIDGHLTATFADVASRKGFPAEDVEAGRAYVKAYVHFIHTVERLHALGASEPE